VRLLPGSGVAGAAEASREVFGNWLILPTLRRGHRGWRSMLIRAMDRVGYVGSVGPPRAVAQCCESEKLVIHWNRCGSEHMELDLWEPEAEAAGSRIAVPMVLGPKRYGRV